MRYRRLGPTGLRVSELCLGTMTFGREWGWGADAATAGAILAAYADAGGNFLDTANIYQNTASETILGDLLAGDRDRYVLATKYTLAHDPAGRDPNAGGSHRKGLVRELSASLERLRTDYVDLLWVHAYDELTPVEETMRALDDAVRQGLVHYVGVSDWPAWAVAKANMYARERGLTPFAALQIEYSLVQRTPERDLIPMARHDGLAVTPWSPLGGGVLTGRYLAGGAGGRLGDGPAGKPEHLRIAQATVDVARDAGCTPAQAAVAWLRAQGADILPIVGASTVDQLRDTLGALDVTLAPQHLARLDEASAITLGFPHDFLRGAGTRDRIYGGLRDEIDG